MNLFFLTMLAFSQLSLKKHSYIYRFITHRVKYFKPLLLVILVTMAYKYSPPKINIFFLRKYTFYILVCSLGKKCETFPEAVSIFTLVVKDTIMRKT